MFCEKCGTKLEEGMTHCPICGLEVPAQPAAEEKELPPEPVQEMPMEPAAEEVIPVPEPEAAPAVIPEPVPVAVPEPAPAPKPKKTAKPRRKPHILLRMLLQLLSFVLCIVLTASLLATVVLADLNHIMSAGGIKQLITAVLNPVSAPQRMTPVVGAAGVYWDETIPGFTIPGDLDLGDLPDDLLTGGDSEESISGIIDWIYEELEKNSEEPLPITKEQVQAFVQDSTLSDFMAEKLAGFAEDFLNNTENTTITAEEVLELLEENAQLIEKTFEVEITAEMKQELSASVEKLVVEADLNTLIREEVFESVKETINESTESMGISWDQLQPMIQLICSDAVLYTALGITLVLMLLLCLLNFYNVPAGLTWIAIPSILLGAILTAPLALLQASPELVSGLLPGGLGPVIASFAGVLLPIHGGLLALGLGLLLIGIIWRAIRSVRRKRLAAA